jgi:ribosomal protein S27AE
MVYVDEFESGGDPVCWLSRVCPECGLLAEQEQAKTCARCGATLPNAEEQK